MGSERENLVTRRAVLPIAAAALASAAAIPAVAAKPSDLAALIEAHRGAKAAFSAACTREDMTPRDAPDYSAAERAWRAANEADEAAFIAVCAYVCRSAEDGTRKAEYLAGMLDLMGGRFECEHIEALLQSIAGGAANV